MSVKELDFNKKLRGTLDEEFDYRIERIESHATAAGLPDNAWLCRPLSRSGWIEVKEVEGQPKKIKYRPRQAPWLYSYSTEGGCCCTIVHIKEGNLALIIPGSLSLIAQRNVGELPITKSNGFPTSVTATLVCLDDWAGWSRLSEAILNS
jgi:hypothetical protein